MFDYPQLKADISAYKANTYTEAKIDRIASDIKKALKTHPFSDSQFYKYITLLAESICATGNLYSLKNAGCFRFRRDFNSTIFKARDILLYFKAELDLSAIDIQYLENLSYIKEISDEENKEEMRLDRELKQLCSQFQRYGSQFSVTLTFCACLEDYVTASNIKEIAYVLGDAPIPKSELTNDMLYKNEFYTIFDVIDAVGLIISKLNNIEKEIPGYQDSMQCVYPDSFRSKSILNIIFIAARIRLLQEIQTSNNIYAYKCKKESKILSLKSNKVNSDLMSINQLGYTMRNICEFNLEPNSELPVAESIYQDVSQHTSLEYAENPSRYRLAIPQILLDALYKVTELSQEEERNIRMELCDLNVNVDIDDDMLYKQLTLLDYIRFHRLFTFFYQAQTKRLYAKFENHEITKSEYCQSLIPHINVDNFCSNFPHYKDKLKDFWELCSFNSTQTNVLDLLYQPVLSQQNTVYPLCAVGKMSNVARNVCVLLKHLGIGFNEDGSHDPLIARLEETFTREGIPCASNVPFMQTDIDFSFLIGDTIYIAECKNNYHPTDIYECRTTLECIYKAERQLSKISNGLMSGKDSALYARLGVRKSAKLKIVSFIISGNRVFAGTNAFKYPVRYFAELLNYIESGEIMVGGKQIYVRTGTKTNENDMAMYLSEHSPTSYFMKQAMTTYEKSIIIGEHQIKFDRYVLDNEKLNQYCIQEWNVSVCANPQTEQS